MAVAGSFVCCSVVILFVCVVLLCVLFEPFKVVVLCRGSRCDKITVLVYAVVLVWLLVRLSTGCGWFC